MSTALTVVLALATVLATPLWLMMAGFAPALLDGASAATALQKTLGSLALGVIWLVPVWVFYFARRAIKAWRGLRSPLPATFIMALPALAMIAFLVVNIGRTAP